MRGIRKKFRFHPKDSPKAPLGAQKNDRIDDETFNYCASAGDFGD